MARPKCCDTYSILCRILSEAWLIAGIVFSCLAVVSCSFLSVSFRYVCFMHAIVVDHLTRILILYNCSVMGPLHLDYSHLELPMVNVMILTMPMA